MEEMKHYNTMRTAILDVVLLVLCHSLSSALRATGDAFMLVNVMDIILYIADGFTIICIMGYREAYNELKKAGY